MKRIIGIGGPPQVGKTAHLKAVLTKLSKAHQLNRVLVVEHNGSKDFKELQDSILSLANKPGVEDHVVLFENEDLFVSKFYCWLEAQGYDPRFFIVMRRGQIPNGPGMAKYQNMAKCPKFTVLSNNDERDLQRNTDRIIAAIMED